MLGNRLKALRLRQNKTQEDMATLLGITRQAYGKYESGKNEPDMSSLSKLADYFEVTADYLMGRSDIKNPESKPEGRFFHDLDHASKEDLNELEDYFKFMQKRRQQREDRDK